MALNSTSRRRFGAAAGAFGVSVVASVALIGMAGTASAHTPKIASDCADDGSWAKVVLTQYNDKQANTVTVTIDGTEADKQEFGKSFEKTYGDLDPSVEHAVSVKVDAWDDPEGNKGWSVTESATIAACVQPTTPPEPSEPTETPSEPAPTTSEPAPPVQEITEEAPPEAAPADEPLAETGASIAIPLGIGGVLLAGGVVLMVVVRRRGRADNQA
ncbi:hypothetical protein BLA60_12095 [Actinophytocola xinjiangensis]|uniref:LPXTG-motif cell wall-anchored protein n=1 Tax=Actinophytocola xinjiangensis TaxID=485602 RepID=A0A7Z0WNL5_9PSEU|nr:hypothetical protein [Actinophytocola xinjiangensis]OLF11667.1 hypothetical protein BLA60_12095 [Actinophytocola xinjiangensis]